jgi:hypothetical protein
MKKRFKNYFVGDNDNVLRFQYTGIIKYVPLIVCGGFFFLTIIIFAFGPLDWHINNAANLYIFLASSCIALVLGYLIAVKKGRTPEIKLNINTNHIFIFCAVIYILLYIPTLISTTGKWYPDIYNGITNTGVAYHFSQYYVQNNSQFIMYIRILFSPLMIMIMPVTFFFFPKLSRASKALGIIVIVLSLCLSISQGVNKGVADITAQIVLILIMMFFSKSLNGSQVKHFFIILGLIILTLGLFFAYYSNAMRNRVSLDNMGYSQQELNSIIQTGETDIVNNVTEEQVDNSVKTHSNFNTATEKQNYFLLKLIPEKLKPTAIYLASYISHGYNGLSIAMNQEFTSSYGLGFSDFFARNFFRVFGDSNSENELFNRTYIAKTSREGWNTGAVWSTFFVYPASDISFPGTILLVLLIGYLFGLSWKDALITENPFAITVFFGFCTMILYFCANNQMFQIGESFVGFIVIIIVWFITRSYLCRRSKKLLAGENN